MAGVGGQGCMLASQTLGRVAMRNGFSASVGETYGASQRGGSVLSHIKIGEDIFGPLVPRGKADVVLGFEPEECLRQSVFYLKYGGIIICNSHPTHFLRHVRGQHQPSIEEIGVVLKKMTEKIVFFDATAMARRTGNALTLNMVMLGAFAASRANPFPKKDFEEEIGVLFPSKENLHAFKLGYEVVT
jgi:indolepyruvate ferredoxin oxidoreductase beta subunit